MTGNAKKALGVVALLLLSTAFGPGSLAAGEEEPPAEMVAPGPGEMPSFMTGVDLRLPAQEAFRAWPPEEVAQRLYPHPWSRQAFDRASLFNRPVLFLLTVPWNRHARHVTAEVLADPRVKRAINDGYILVVADADRRPDLRERYQTGTWPVLALLLPDGRPILSQANPLGVAMPITAGDVDEAGMLFLLEEGITYYQKWSSFLKGLGEYWSRREGPPDPVAGTVSEEGSDQVARWLVGNADRRDGGFGAAPKFLVPGLMEYARIREARLAPALVEAAHDTLEKLLRSPLYDPLHGGIHRLATAPGYAGIQYEKMLEGNSALMRDLCFALRAKETPAFRTALAQTARFVTTVLARSGGGFYHAQGADPRSKDGGAYWTDPSSIHGPAPPIDRLVLSGTNALTGAALLRAAAILDDDALAQAGKTALNLVLDRAYAPARGVNHVVDPKPDGRRFLVSQAEVAFAMAEAYEATGNARYLDAAGDIVDFSLRNLRAPDETLLRDHLLEPGAPGILGNPRRPLPDNVLLARTMLRLAAQGRGDAYREQGHAILGAYAGNLGTFGVHGVAPALAIEEALREPLIIRINGEPDDPRARALRRAALGVFWPWTVISTAPGPPAAVLTYRGSSRRVDDPAKMADAVRDLAIFETSEPPR